MDFLLIKHFPSILVALGTHKEANDKLKYAGSIRNVLGFYERFSFYPIEMFIFSKVIIFKNS